MTLLTKEQDEHLRCCLATTGITLGGLTLIGFLTYVIITETQPEDNITIVGGTTFNDSGNEQV